MVQSDLTLLRGKKYVALPKHRRNVKVVGVQLRLSLLDSVEVDDSDLGVAGLVGLTLPPPLT